MATTYNNCQMGIVDASGNLSVIYPQTKASLVSCDSAKYGGSSNVTNVQSALNNLSTALGNYLPLSGGTMTGTIVTPRDTSGDVTSGIEPYYAGSGQVGSSSKYYHRSYISLIYTEEIRYRRVTGDTYGTNLVSALTKSATNNTTIKVPHKNGTMNVLTETISDTYSLSRYVMLGETDGGTSIHNRLMYIAGVGNLFVNNSSGKRCWSIWDDDIDSTSSQTATLALGNTESSTGARKGRLVLYSPTDMAAQLTAHTDGTLCNNGYGVIISQDMNHWRITQMLPSGDSSSSYVHCNTTNGAYGINWWLSDTKLKENIEDTEVTALDKVDNINFIQFDWKKDNSHVDLGVSANQIEEFMPDAVWNIKQPDDYEYDTIKNIDTGKMTTYALKAIQELHEIVKKQQEEIDELKALLSKTN